MGLARNFQNRRWLIVVPVLLLAALLAGRQLNTWAFSIDEGYSMRTAGARASGPRSLAETLQFGIAVEKTNATGWMLIMNLWGNMVGWTTVAVRSASWFAGLLTLALVYQVGRSLFAEEAGVNAVLLLTASTMFISFMHVARTYTLVALFSTLALWSYWRLALDPRPAARRHKVALLLGCAGLFYTHFLAALMLPAIGVVHFFFVRKNRRWRQTTLLLSLAALIVVPELAVLFQAVENQAAGGATAFAAPQMSIQLLYALSNSLISLPQRAGPGLLFVLVVLLAVLLLRRPRNGEHPAWLAGVVALLTLLLILAANEFVAVFEYRDRVR